MNSRDTIKSRADMIEKRYGKTTKGAAKSVKKKTSIKPILTKNKVGLKVKVAL